MCFNVKLSFLCILCISGSFGTAFQKGFLSAKGVYYLCFWRVIGCYKLRTYKLEDETIV